MDKRVIAVDTNDRGKPDRPTEPRQQPTLIDPAAVLPEEPPGSPLIDSGLDLHREDPKQPPTTPDEPLVPPDMH